MSLKADTERLVDEIVTGKLDRKTFVRKMKNDSRKFKEEFQNEEFKELKKEIIELKSEVSELLLAYSTSRKNMGDDLRLSLNEFMSSLRQDVESMLKSYKEDIKGAEAAWDILKKSNR